MEASAVDDSILSSQTKVMLVENCVISSSRSPLRGMVSVRYDEIPEFLRKGDFFAALCEDDADTIMIPSECYKKDENINSTADLVHVLSSIRFFGVVQPPREVIGWMLTHPANTYKGDISRFDQELLYLSDLVNIAESTDQLCTAIDLGMMPAIHWLLSAGKLLPDDACFRATKGGHLECLQFLVRMGCKVKDCDCDSIACTRGHLNCLAFLFAQGMPIRYSAVVEAACHGHISCLQFALNNGYKPRRDAVTAAIEGNHLPCLSLLLDNGWICDEDLLCEIAEHGHVECLKYAFERFGTWPDLFLAYASFNPKLDCFIWGLEHHCPPTEGDFIHFLLENRSHRHIEILIQYDVAQWGPQSFELAVSSGRTELVEHAVTHGGPLSAELCACAAHPTPSIGIPILNLLRQYNCPWDESCCASAAWRGNLEFLQHVHELGAPWDGATPAAALRKGNLPCLQYALEQGCPVSADRLIAARKVAASVRNTGHLACLTYLRSKGGIDVENATDG